MRDFRDWSDGWIKSGHFVSYILNGIRYYEYVFNRDLAHYEYPWGAETLSSLPTTIDALDDSGPFTPEWLEITRGYDKTRNTNQIWQMIFGIKGQVYIYIELPTDTFRHGLPKIVKPGNAFRRIGHFEEWMSSYQEPTFITQHFLMRTVCSQIGFDAYNPNNIDQTDVWLNIFINKMQTERIGTETDRTATPSRDRYTDTLDKLIRKLIPCTPIDLLPVTAPAEAPAGE